MNKSKGRSRLFIPALLLSLLSFFIAPGTHAGIWLNAESIQAVDFDFVEARNKDLVANGKPKQWMGIRLNLTWGDVQSTSNVFDFEALEKVLNDAQALNYKVILTISDKYWRYRISGKWQAYDGSAVPSYLDGSGELLCSDFALFTQGSCNSQYDTSAPFSGVANDTYRIARQHYIQHKGWFARKYGAKRWNGTIMQAWLNELWPALANHIYDEKSGSKISDHPALYAIITPESSFPGVSKYDQLLELGYPGGSWYVGYLVKQAKTLKKLFPNTPIISSINWITPNKKTESNNGYYQEDAAAGLLKLDSNKTSIGWFTQDITNNFANYDLMVYPQMSLFPSKLRYGMITGESHKSSFTDTTKEEGLLNLAHDIGVRHLLFNTKSYSYGATGNRAIYDLIANADPGDYSFLESGSLPEIRAIRIHEENPSRLVLYFSEPMRDLGDLSAGFTIRIDGTQEDIQSYQRHWNDKNRILLTLGNRIYSDSVVQINYAQNIGRIQDMEGDELADVSLTSQGGVIDNLTTTLDPANLDTEAPQLHVVAPISAFTNNPKPNFIFASSEAGTISYQGSCSSGTTATLAGDNTITLDALSDGTYSDCKINVTDTAGNVSDPLAINSFTVDTTQPVIQSAVVWEGEDANRIAVFASETITDVSRSGGFSVTVNGKAAAISMVKPHESINRRVWITLSDRICEGETVEVSYNGNGTITDIAGNDLAQDQVDVDNNTTTSADPAPEMQSAVIWEGNHANRIALTVSEDVTGASGSGGFSVTIDGQTGKITDVAPHPSIDTKIWLTLSDRVHAGERVNLNYNGNGSIQDSAQNALTAGSILVSNSTTK